MTARSAHLFGKLCHTLDMTLPRCLNATALARLWKVRHNDVQRMLKEAQAERILVSVGTTRMSAIRNAPVLRLAGAMTEREAIAPRSSRHGPASLSTRGAPSD